MTQSASSTMDSDPTRSPSDVHPQPAQSGAQDGFVAAMRQAASGVTVVTATDKGKRWGVTVSAMTSVSAEPPLLLVCINARSPVCAAIESAGAFCVNILAENQHAVSDVFAGRIATESGERFDCGRWRDGATGAPGLEDSAARFHCKLEACHHHGSHRIFIGRVVEAEAGETRPLLYCDRSYGRVALH